MVCECLSVLGKIGWTHPGRCAVRLGNSGLKVSRIILGTMQYGSSKWQDWVLDEPEAIEHIKFA